MLTEKDIEVLYQCGKTKARNIIAMLKKTYHLDYVGARVPINIFCKHFKVPLDVAIQVLKELG